MSMSIPVLERHQEAISSDDSNPAIQHNDYLALFNQTSALLKLGRYEEAVASYDKVLEINPEFSLAWYSRGYVLLYNLKRYEEAINSIGEALRIQPSTTEAWANLGVALYRSKQYEEAIASYNKALEIKPNFHPAMYNQACCYALQGNVEQAIENLQQAINLSPNKYREFAKTDSDFDSIRDSEQFQALIQNGSIQEEEDISELPQKLSWEEAVNLFKMKRISSGKAAQLLGTDRVSFLLSLQRYGAAMIDLEEEELLSDLENA